MRQRKLILYIAIIAAVLLVAYYLSKNKNEGFNDYIRDLPTSPEVELIQGGPNFDVVDANGNQVIHSGDIALGAGYGIGEGTVGFGRYGSSFMA